MKKLLKVLALFLFASQVSVASAATFQYSDDTCVSFSMTGSGSVYTIQCEKGIPVVGAPTGCALSANPLAFASASAGSATLAVSCAGGATAATTYQFYVNNVSQGSATTGASKVVTIPANATASAVSVSVKVTACNGSACADATSAVQVAAAASSGGGDNLCGSYKVISTDITKPVTLTSSKLGAFGGQTVILGSFTATTSGRVTMVEQGGPSVGRTISISKNKCDFRDADQSGANGPLFITRGDAWPTLYYTVGSGGLVAGQTYYVNIINTDYAMVNTCSSSTCPASITHK